MKKQQGFIVAVVPFGFILFLAAMFFGWVGYTNLSADAEKEEYMEKVFPSELVSSYVTGKKLTLFTDEIVSIYDKDDTVEIFGDFCADKNAGAFTRSGSLSPSADATAASEYHIECTLETFKLSLFETIMLIDGDRIEDFMDDNDIDMDSLKKYEEPKPVVEEVKEVAPVIMQPVQPVSVQVVEPALDVTKTPITVSELMAMEEWFGGYLQERCDNMFFNGSTFEMVPGSAEVNVEFYEDSRDYYTITCANPKFRKKATGVIEETFQQRDVKIMRMTLRRMTQ